MKGGGQRAGAVADDRPQTLGEEIANSLTHGVALALSVVWHPFVLAGSAAHFRAAALSAGGGVRG